MSGCSGAALKAWRRSRSWDAAEMARRLRAAAREAGQSVASLESLARMIYDWERAEHALSERYQLLYVQALGVSPDDLARGPAPSAAAQPSDGSHGGHAPLVAATGGVIPLHPDAALLMPDPDLYERITSALDDRCRVDPAVIAWLERCLDEHRRVEDTIGSGPLVGVIKSQLSTVADFARQAPTRLTGQVVNLAAQYAQFMAWLCADQGDNLASLAWYDRAHDWAMEAGDAGMASTAISMKAHRAWSVGDSPRCVRLAEAARWSDKRTTPGVQGMAAQMIARGHAIGGDPDGAHRAIDEAQSLITATARHPEDEPPWMYFYGETWFTAQRGMIEADLAERGKGQPREAVALLEQALADLPDTYKRDRAWYGALLARAHHAAGDSDAAIGTGLIYAPDAKAVNRYAADELEHLAGRLRNQGVVKAGLLSEALAAA